MCHQCANYSINTVHQGGVMMEMKIRLIFRMFTSFLPQIFTIDEMNFIKTNVVGLVEMFEVKMK